MWILREIEQRGGEVGFRGFMELALYHPEHGYYTSTNAPWGRDGDFLTAPTASGWYGATWARLLTELSARVGHGLALVDVAAGSGSFLESVLDSLGDEGRRAVDRAQVVDRSPTRRRELARRFADGETPVLVSAEIGGAGNRPAVAHASELYDAMPVHRVERGPDGLEELTVVATKDRLEWGRRPAGAELEDYLRGHGVELVGGQIAEINLDAEPAHRRLLESVGEGAVLVLDYGYPARRLYDARGRRRGSLATYRRHELGTDPLENPGQQDLTAHVNWDDLRRAASTAGWFEIALMPLAEFLVRAGLGRILDERGLGMEAELDAETVSTRQEVKRLLDPEGMGSDLKMLVQGRGHVGELAGELLNRNL
jgi:SAM-dependent MidA family methyltransferase